MSPPHSPDGANRRRKDQRDLKNGKFTDVQLDTQDPLSKLPGTMAISQLAAGDGKQIIQIKCIANDANSWKWASDLYNFELMDDGGASHRPSGGWCVIGKGDAEKMLGGYISGGHQKLQPSPPTTTPSPTRSGSCSACPATAASWNYATAARRSWI